MPEKETIFSSKVKVGGIFNFQDFYQFCHDWLTEEFGLNVSEAKYVEKISGDSKNIDVKWACTAKATDYFKFLVIVKFKVVGLKKVEIETNGIKQKTNQGSVEVSISSTLIRDWQGKFEENGFQKFLRSIYEKWIIQSRVGQFEDKLVGGSNEFLEQAKAYLDLEGKR